MISIKNLCKTYEGKEVKTEALKDINLSVKENELLAIIGKSGSGKSTLLNILGGMDKFNSGEYKFKGKDVQKLDHKKLAEFRNKEIGFVFQSFNLINEMNVLENIEMSMGYAGVGKKERKKRAMEMLMKVDMVEKAKSFPNELSGGQQQRVAIARALVNNPGVILADEPTGNLDTKTGAEIMKLLKEIHKSGATIIIITHDEGIAEQCQRSIKIKDGFIHTECYNIED